MPPLYPDNPPTPGQGVVWITLSTGLELQAEYISGQWWSHLNDNPEAAPIADSYVVSWRPLD